MPDIYRYEWTGQRTGRTYQIDIARSELTALGGSPTVEMLNNDAIRECKDWTWEFDKFPIGPATLMQPTITFNADRIPSTLLTWITEPPTQHTVTLGYGVDVNVYAGCPVLVRVNGDIRWSGNIDTTIRHRPDAMTGALEVSVVDSFKVAAKAVTAIHLRDYTHGWAYANKATDVVESRYVVDVVWGSGLDYSRYKLQAGAGAYVWGMKRRTLWNLWDDCVELVVRAVSRRALSVALRPELETLYTGLREQRYSDTDTWPSATVVADADVYCTPFICDEDDNLLTSIYDDWQRNYPSYYDVLVDMVRQPNRPAAIFISLETYTISHYPRLTPPNAAADVTQHMRDTEPDLYGRVLQNATMSYEFAKGDDLDKYEAAFQSGRNDETMTVPVIWNWCISASGWSYGSATETYATLQSLNKFYYLDTLELGAELIRCHSWWSTGGTAPSSSPYTLTISAGDGLGIVDQQSWGVMQQGATELRTVFGDAMGTTVPSVIAGTVPLDAAPLMSFLVAYQPLTIDVPSFASWLTIAPTTWHVTKWSCDLFTELVEVEAYAQ